MHEIRNAYKNLVGTRQAFYV